MTDDARPAHPPPWRWVQRKMGNWSDDDERAANRLVLVDANGDYIIDTDGDDYSWVTVETPYVRAVTELAPEMETLLRNDYAGCFYRDGRCTFCLLTDGHSEECPMAPTARLLARLDAARKANP